MVLQIIRLINITNHHEPSSKAFCFLLECESRVEIVKKIKAEDIY
jgi:hypothetical protein